MPQLDISTYTSQIFWLLVCFFMLLLFLSNFIVPKIIETRKLRMNKIDSYLQKAEKTKQKTENSIAKYEKSLADATNKANLEIEKTKEELEKMLLQQQEKFAKKLQKQIQAEEAKIAEEKTTALKEIKSISANLTAEILKKLDISNVEMSDIKSIINREAQ